MPPSTRLRLLVLLDVMMPVFDGGDVANQFACDPRLNQISIVFLTAAVRQSEVEDHAGCFGGQRFLSKPVALAELLECLDGHFADSRQHA